jgi:hypothetical protein
MTLLDTGKEQVIYDFLGAVHVRNKEIKAFHAVRSFAMNVRISAGAVFARQKNIPLGKGTCST